MFCTKCGKELPESGVCSCQQPAQPAAPQPPAQPATPQPPVQPAAPQPPVQPVAPQPPVQPAAPQPPVQPAAPKPPVQPAAPQQSNNGSFVPPQPSDNRHTYSLIAYLPFLWLFGMLVAPEKDDPRVRFHVGQGLILNIFGCGLVIIATILTLILSALGDGEALATALILLVWLFVLGAWAAMTVFALLKVSNRQDNYLPLIGRLSFYK